MILLHIKLLAIDLDDTLLRPDLTISRESITRIKQARDQGVLVTLATGRMYRSALPYALQIEIEVPLISYQGALVKNIQKEDILYYKPVPAVYARAIMNYFKQRGVHFHSYFDDHLCLEKQTPEGDFYKRLAGVEASVLPDLMTALNDYDAIKIMAVADDENLLLEMEAELEEEFGGKLYITRSKPCFLEVMHIEATKVDALKYLAACYDISPQQIMVIGDSYNDLGMIRWAGVGVAMENAREQVKDAADYITGSNEADGVAQAIERFILA